MLPKLEYIKQARMRLGITQKKLAALTSISSSMINQIESGRCKPSYDTARKIFEALLTMEEKTSLKAGDICNKKVISVQKYESLTTAISKLRTNSISQIPVFDGSKVIGIISEDGLAKNMSELNEKIMKNLTIISIMESPPPIVDISTPAKAIIPLVRFSKCVLVSEQGDVIGIITVSDTLKMFD